MNYSINVNILALSLLPILKRTPIIESYLTALLSPIQELNDMDNYFITGGTYSYYATSSTYNLNDIVIGGLDYNNQVYKSIIGTNSNNLPSDVNSWELWSNSFIGMDTRSKIYDSKLGLEYILNTYYNTI